MRKENAMEIIDYLKNYWTQLIFFAGMILGFIKFAFSMIEGIKCSLRNDILTIFDRCKGTETITHYQLEAIEHSAELYFKLKGNSFVKQVLEKVRKYKIID